MGDSCNTLAFTINDTSGQKNICGLWKDHYKGILNSNHGVNVKQKVLDQLTDCTFDKPVLPDEVFACIKKLKRGKTCGTDNLQGEHFIYASDKVCVLLSLLFNAMILHGYICQELMDTILTPIIKDKKGNISCKDNYRPIAVTSVVSKILESVVLMHYYDCLVTKCNQFGFKKGHSTDLCTFAFKQIIDYYTSKGSPVYICYLDASKAFDKINFWILFEKLLIRKVPVIIVRLLVFWYTRQKFMVRWGSCYSDTFEASNGVRQGSVLSPHLFNVYMDDLGETLNGSKLGCFINNTPVNHLMYADDTVLLAPSAKALQCLILLCESYAKSHDISFNVKKSVYMCIKPKSLTNISVPTIVLNSCPINLVDTYKYLGVLICSSNCDDAAITSQISNIYTRGNILISHFKHCSKHVKCELFKTYFSSFYCCQLWCNYAKETGRRFKVAYNRVFRVLLQLDRRTSMSQAFIECNILHSSVILRKSMFSFLTRVSTCENSIIKSIFNSSHFFNSVMFNHWCANLFT